MARPAGSLNKITTEVKDMIQEALTQAGGVKYLLEQAQKNPQAFMSLVGKIIPRDLKVSGELHHTLETMILDAVKHEGERIAAPH
jgi:hypothetical protein